MYKIGDVERKVGFRGSFFSHSLGRVYVCTCAGADGPFVAVNWIFCSPSASSFLVEMKDLHAGEV